MGSGYKNTCCIHAIDDSTLFLSDFRQLNTNLYIQIEPNDNSVEKGLEIIKLLEPSSLIIFLGHGHSSGLYSPETSFYEKKIIINAEIGNQIFNNHDVLLLSCKSSDFIRYLNKYRNIIGFGNILSSLGELRIEAEYSGYFRNVSEEDIYYFNKSYVNAILEALKLLTNDKISFKALPQWISYFINRQINQVLKRKDKPNRIELAKLLFEFRNEIVCKSK